MRIFKNILSVPAWFILYGTAAEAKYIFVGNGNINCNTIASGGFNPTREDCEKWCDSASGCVSYSWWGPGNDSGTCFLYDSNAPLS